MSKLRRLARDAADAALQLTLPLFDLLPRSRSQTPQGRKVVVLEHDVVDYALRRSGRRTIGFLIDDRGLTVTAPRWVSQAEIERSLQEKAHWIQRKRQEWREHAARRERLSTRWEDGASLPYLGGTLVMRIDRLRARGVHLQDGELRIASAAAADAQAMKAAVQHWMKAQARVLFAERIAHLSQRLGAAPSRWGLSSARTRWGSCGPDGAIRLNWRLMHFPPDIIDYVVAHELAHLRELNHGPRFWALVATLHPDYQRAREWLRAYPDDVSVD